MLKNFVSIQGSSSGLYFDKYWKFIHAILSHQVNNLIFMTKSDLCLNCITKRNANLRPSADNLLQHPWISNVPVPSQKKYPVF